MQSISKSDALQERKPKLESMAVAGVDGLIGFDAIGPKYIHANSPSVKRICMPCVVKEAYGERGLYSGNLQAARTGTNSPAAFSWYEPFNYKLKRLLLCPADGYIFGAIFVWS